MALAGTRYVILRLQRQLCKSAGKSIKCERKQEVDDKRAHTIDGRIIVVGNMNISTCRIENAMR
jgi:hypothetical protein